MVNGGVESSNNASYRSTSDIHSQTTSMREEPFTVKGITNRDSRLNESLSSTDPPGTLLLSGGPTLGLVSMDIMHGSFLVTETTIQAPEKSPNSTQETSISHPIRGGSSKHFKSPLKSPQPAPIHRRTSGGESDAASPPTDPAMSTSLFSTKRYKPLTHQQLGKETWHGPASGSETIIPAGSQSHRMFRSASQEDVPAAKHYGIAMNSQKRERRNAESAGLKASPNVQSVSTNSKRMGRVASPVPTRRSVREKQPKRALSLCTETLPNLPDSFTNSVSSEPETAGSSVAKDKVPMYPLRMSRKSPQKERRRASSGSAAGNAKQQTLRTNNKGVDMVVASALSADKDKAAGTPMKTSHRSPQKQHRRASSGSAAPTHTRGCQPLTLQQLGQDTWHGPVSGSETLVPAAPRSNRMLLRSASQGNVPYATHDVTPHKSPRRERARASSVSSNAVPQFQSVSSSIDRKGRAVVASSTDNDQTHANLPDNDQPKRSPVRKIRTSPQKERKRAPSLSAEHLLGILSNSAREPVFTVSSMAGDTAIPSPLHKSRRSPQKERRRASSVSAETLSKFPNSVANSVCSEPVRDVSSTARDKLPVDSLRMRRKSPQKERRRASAPSTEALPKLDDFFTKKDRLDSVAALSNSDKGKAPVNPVQTVRRQGGPRRTDGSVISAYSADHPASLLRSGGQKPLIRGSWHGPVGSPEKICHGPARSPEGAVRSSPRSPRGQSTSQQGKPATKPYQKSPLIVRKKASSVNRGALPLLHGHLTDSVVGCVSDRSHNEGSLVESVHNGEALLVTAQRRRGRRTDANSHKRTSASKSPLVGRCPTSPASGRVRSNRQSPANNPGGCDEQRPLHDNLTDTAVVIYDHNENGDIDVSVSLEGISEPTMNSNKNHGSRDPSPQHRRHRATDSSIKSPRSISSVPVTGEGESKGRRDRRNRRRSEDTYSPSVPPQATNPNSPRGSSSRKGAASLGHEESALLSGDRGAIDADGRLSSSFYMDSTTGSENHATRSSRSKSGECRKVHGTERGSRRRHTSENKGRTSSSDAFTDDNFSMMSFVDDWGDDLSATMMLPTLDIERATTAGEMLY
jgi:hypothetical protein